jgi:hypothetical protein
VKNRRVDQRRDMVGQHPVAGAGHGRHQPDILQVPIGRQGGHEAHPLALAELPKGRKRISGLHQAVLDGPGQLVCNVQVEGSHGGSVIA